jgi:predicted Zn-dependent protease
MRFLAPRFLGTLLLVTGCVSSPFTGRKGLQLLPDSQLQQMAAAEYQSFLAQHELTDNERLAEQVRRIGERIAVAAHVAMEAEGRSDAIADYEWEFNVVESEQVNAFAMPGGKVVVFTGILPIARDEDGLAVIMGHEIAHALAEHGNERMSQVMLAQLGAVALDVALSERPAETRQLFNLAYGVGAQLGVLLPFSRTHEREADEIGLYLSTMAGYDPRAAAPLWERMAAVAPRAPEFLSTHPDPLERAEDLKAMVPRALEYREEHGAEVERRLEQVRSSERRDIARGTWALGWLPAF